MKKLVITKPDDFHVHLRQHEMLELTVKHTGQQFSRAIVMPNLIPPVTNNTLAEEYLSQINHILKNKLNNINFKPLLTLYLTDKTSTDTIEQASKNPSIIACKLYPAGATTNSDYGVTNIKNIYNILEAMEKNGLALLVHGEVTEYNIDIFDREKVFIDKILINIREKFPKLKITLEHISTKHAVDFILNYNNNYTAATITPHHLLLNRNDLLAGGLKPHYYCLPILKNQENQQAVIEAALSGNKAFFAGSDSAPHTIEHKQSACGCAGIYHGPNTVLLYAEFFDRYKQIDKLENFISIYGAQYYNLKLNKTKITLINKNHTIPDYYSFKNNKIIPLFAGKKINWSFDI